MMITKSKTFEHIWCPILSKILFTCYSTIYYYAIIEELRIPREKTHFGGQPEESTCLASQSFWDEKWICGTPFRSQPRETAGYFVESTWRFAMLAAGNSVQGWTVITTNSLVQSWMWALTLCYCCINLLFCFKHSIGKHIEKHAMQ